MVEVGVAHFYLVEVILLFCGILQQKKTTIVTLSQQNIDFFRVNCNLEDV
jgi:hypothetical protein